VFPGLADDFAQLESHRLKTREQMLNFFEGKRR
jgi:hypothetical protein